jgi:hypothetical protein
MAALRPTPPPDRHDGVNSYGSDHVLVPRSMLEEMQRRLDDMQRRMDEAEEERDEVITQLQAVQTRLDHVVANQNRQFEGLFSDVDELNVIQNYHCSILLKSITSPMSSPAGICYPNPSCQRPQLTPPPSPPTSRYRGITPSKPIVMPTSPIEVRPPTPRPSSQAPPLKPNSNSMSHPPNPWQKPRHTRAPKKSENYKARE